MSEFLTGHAAKFLSDACACGVGMVTKPRPNLLAHKRGEAAKSSNLTLPHQTCSRSQLLFDFFSMMDEEYILRWNDHGVSFFALAEDLLQQELLTDVTIWCGDRVFDAHRLVLCACSPLFKSMLTRQRLQRSHAEQIVFLRDVSAVHFERLLQFMYCGEVRVPNNELEDLLATATSLSVRGLANAQDRCGAATSAVANDDTQQPLPLLKNKTSSLPPKAHHHHHHHNNHMREQQAPLMAASSPCLAPAAPPKKRRISKDASEHQHKKSPLSPLDSNRLLMSPSLASYAGETPPPLNQRGECLS